MTKDLWAEYHKAFDKYRLDLSIYQPEPITEVERLHLSFDGAIPRDRLKSALTKGDTNESN